MNTEKFRELLARATATAAASKARSLLMETEMLEQNVTDVDLTKAGIDDKSLETAEGRAHAVEVIKEIVHDIGETLAPAPLDGKQILGVARDDITLNDKQQSFNDTVQSGNDCVLVGAAGTGKTTSMRTVTKNLVASGRIGNLKEGTKWLRGGNPGAAILSYTRKAVNNIRHAVADEFKPHTLTIHKILEFAPIYYEIEDPNKPGFFKKTMRFEPQRNESNPLPTDLVLLAFEESSMISLELYQQLMDAMPHKHQEIFLGDIQQLPPIFGLAVLGFKMNELPVIELTEIYRQALASPIINLAWKLLGGNPHEFSSKTEYYETYSEFAKKTVKRIRCPVLDDYSQKTPAGEVKFQVWQKRLSSDNGLITFIKQANTWADQGYYNPEEDIILCPYNKAFGTVEINKGIMQHLGAKRGATVYHIIAGFNNHYLAVGDRVLYDKEDAWIVSINRNGEYLGKAATPPSIHLDRWGHYQQNLTDAEQEKHALEGDTMDMDAIEKFMSAASLDEGERVQSASHVVTIRLGFSDEEIVLDSAMEINNLLGGYALTVHKFQGSECDKVFFVMHNTHAVMNQRELLYTAVTRAKKFLHIICETDTFEKGIKSQRIRGDTLAEKAEFFKGKASENARDKAKEIELLSHIHKGNSAVTTISGKPAIRISDIVPENFRKKAELKLEVLWNFAKFKISDKIGEPPALNYEISSGRLLGRAKYSKNLVQLNPVWCAAAEQDAEVEHEMLEETLGHELGHIIAKRLHGERGHGPMWKVVMLKLGYKPARVYTGDVLPPWTDTKQELLRKILAEHKLEVPSQDSQEQEIEE